VVEDDPGTRETLSEMLSLNGADVRAAASAAVAMDIFGAFRPELLVCDIAMPDEDGYSLIGRIRALGRDRGGQVPAVAITALAAAEDRQHALGAGFDRHLAKPVDVDRLLAALSRLLPTATTSSGAADRYTPDA
jgi:two-component system CheB/CheR fusion protein